MLMNIPTIGGVTGLVRPSRAEEIDKRVALLDKESYLMLEKDNQFNGWESFLTWWYGSPTGLQDSLRYSELIQYGVKDVIALTNLAAFTVARQRALGGQPPLTIAITTLLSKSTGAGHGRLIKPSASPTPVRRMASKSGPTLGLGTVSGRDRLG